jgi:hypothetical protein
MILSTFCLIILHYRESKCTYTQNQDSHGQENVNISIRLQSLLTLYRTPTDVLPVQGAEISRYMLDRKTKQEQESEIFSSKHK